MENSTTESSIMNVPPLESCTMQYHTAGKFHFGKFHRIILAFICRGYMCSHADLSPQFAGTLFGLTNTLASIPGFLSPTITGFITKNNETIAAWNTVFLITSAIYGATTTFYLVVIRADVQHWNFIHSDISDEESKETQTTTENQHNS